MAVATGTNAGFVTTAPSSDPEGNDVEAIDKRAAALKAVAPATATQITEMGWYNPNATEEANYELGLYAHDAVEDEPGALLDSVQTHAKGTSAGWKSGATAFTISGGETYWLACQCDDTDTITNMDSQTETTGRWTKDNTVSTFENPWDQGQGMYDSALLALYAVTNEAFPKVEGTNTSTTASSTNHVIDLPADIQAGETLIAMIILDSGSDDVSWPAGWNSIIKDNSTTFVEGDMAWSKATGEEGASITATTSNSRVSAHTSMRISGAADPTSSAPEGAGWDSGGSSDANPDPPNLEPTGGSKNYLWIVAEGTPDVPTISSYPTNYTDNQLNASRNYVEVATATREATGSSENPGTFTLGYGDRCIALTVAVYPEEAATGTSMKINIGDAWKEVPAAKINIGDAWKDVAAAKINIGDAWKDIF